MVKRAVKNSQNIKETAKIAEEFLADLLKNKAKAGQAVVVGLSGELGAGKTAFTQAIAKLLGITRKVNSPTFVIMKKYPIKKGIKNNKYKFLFHLDAYRLKNEKELLHLGWEEIIGNDEHLVIIEWPENVAKVMPKHTKKIKISHTDKEEQREYNFSNA